MILLHHLVLNFLLHLFLLLLWSPLQCGSGEAYLKTNEARKTETDRVSHVENIPPRPMYCSPFSRCFQNFSYKVCSYPHNRFNEIPSAMLACSIYGPALPSNVYFC